MKDALATLGTIIDENEARDAVHIAVIPAQASESMQPGTHVVLAGKRASRAINERHGIGIVDPFLSEAVAVGEWFWVCLYPRTITSLRHVWTHPSIPDVAEVQKPTVSESEQWLRDFVDSSDCPDYHTVIAKALNNDDAWDSEYLHFNGRDAHGEIPAEFYDHLENVTGQKVPERERARYFSCSC